MAEKEERIVYCVIKKGYDCDYCLLKDGYQYRQCQISNYDCMYDKYGKCSLGMTRQEAIERMEKAMKQYAKDEEIYTDKDLAICALNALLEDK